MTVKDIVDHCPDNKILLRDYETGLIIKTTPICDYWEHKVIKFYARSHRCGVNYKNETEIVVMIRAKLDRE